MFEKLQGKPEMTCSWLSMECEGVKKKDLKELGEFWFRQQGDWIDRSGT